MLQVANLGLSIEVTDNPDCPPAPCPVVPQANRLFLSVWFSVTTQNQFGVETSFKPLLRLRLR
jgi:hypothetical protein